MYSLIVTITALVLFILLTGLITYVFYKSKYDKIKGIILSIIEHINTYLYLYLIPFPILYLCFYYFFFNNIELNYQKEKLPFFYKPEVADFLKNLSIIFFSGGVFSATVKLINSLVIFKKQFKDIIISQEFKSVLSDELETIALSDNYLLKRSDLEDVWKRVTICRFEKAFPSLKNQISNKLQNDFFNDKMLTYYYNNFRIELNLKLTEDNIVEITEVSNFKIIANSKNPINLEFKLSSESPDDDRIFTKLITKDCKVDNKIIDFTETSIINNRNKVFSTELKNKLEYIIERKILLTQDLNHDRVFSFSSSIIIDNMDITINTCDKLTYFFSACSKNVFVKDNHLNRPDSLITREVILPGEKFKLFIYKK